MVRVAAELRRAAFVERPNRFVVVADVDGERIRAHLPNPGRLTEFLHEGTPFLLAPADGADRVTSWDVVAGRHNDGWVVLDTRLANDVLLEALRAGRLDDTLGPVQAVETEPAHGDGRLDLAVHRPGAPLLVEVKSVTLLDEADGETGLFPDAPTERGVRHLRELTQRAEAGDPAALVFVALRADVERIRPHRATDPTFADALAAADAAGVGLHGFRTRFVGGELGLGEAVPVQVV